ncbi:MAG: STAS domain-containing protein [Oscillospiraceae bacterium]|nr:STAS domain-containing protein [Oscillospiraceae bacterium]
MLSVKLFKSGTKVTLLMEGRMDTQNAPAIQEKLLELAKSCECVTADIANLQYISSAGLRAFLRVHKEMEKKDGKFVIRNTRRDVMDVFNVTGFSRFLRFE